MVSCFLLVWQLSQGRMHSTILTITRTIVIITFLSKCFQKSPIYTCMQVEPCTLTNNHTSHILTNSLRSLSTLSFGTSLVEFETNKGLTKLGSTSLVYQETNYKLFRAILKLYVMFSSHPFEVKWAHILHSHFITKFHILISLSYVIMSLRFSLVKPNLNTQHHYFWALYNCSHAEKIKYVNNMI